MNVKHRLQVCPSLSAAANVVIVNGPLVCPEDEGGQWSPAGGRCVVRVLQQPPHGDVLLQKRDQYGRQKNVDEGTTIGVSAVTFTLTAT